MLPGAGITVLVFLTAGAQRVLLGPNPGEEETNDGLGRCTATTQQCPRPRLLRALVHLLAHELVHQTRLPRAGPALPPTLGHIPPSAAASGDTPRLLTPLVHKSPKAALLPRRERGAGAQPCLTPLRNGRYQDTAAATRAHVGVHTAKPRLERVGAGADDIPARPGRGASAHGAAAGASGGSRPPGPAGPGTVARGQQSATTARGCSARQSQILSGNHHNNS